MAKMIQVRNVPDDLHRKLKERAARAGMSLSDYLLADLRKIAERPTPEEIAQRLRGMRPIHLGDEPAKAIRQGRVER